MLHRKKHGQLFVNKYSIVRYKKERYKDEHKRISDQADSVQPED